MSAPAPAETVGDLETVDLAELELNAALQTRKDRKYLVPRDAVGPIVEQLQEHARVLCIGGVRTFRYESVYFDTPALASYLDAARGRPRRYKVRTRSYLDTDECRLEVKIRERTGLTVKHAIPYAVANRARLTPAGLAFVAGFDALAPVAGSLCRTLTTRYHRTTLLEDSSASRVTIDTDLECVSADGGRVCTPDFAIVETKTAGGPSRADRLLWAAHFRPVKVSKYGTALAALDEALPANKWTRVLRTLEASGAPERSML